MWRRQSYVAIELGTAGARACQLRQRRNAYQIADALKVDVTGEPCAADAPSAVHTAQRLSRLIGQGRFEGRQVNLVLSPPDVQFQAVRTQPALLTQPPERVCEALRWEVCREMRAEPDEIEVRFWPLPARGAQSPNVMTVAVPSIEAEGWFDRLAQENVHLRRIDVSPCALVRLAGVLAPPAEKDLWGVLDLGRRHLTLTVVTGNAPTYVRSWPEAGAEWTRRLAAALDMTPQAAERIKRTHGLSVANRPADAQPDGRNPGRDIDSVLYEVLRDPIDNLVREITRCFAYQVSSEPDLNVTRLWLAGGGAKLAGLPHLLELQLGFPVAILGNSNATGLSFGPDDAAAVGASILDLEGAP